MNTQPKIKAISDISRDIAQVFFASVFIGPLVSGSADLFLIFSGSLLSVMCWFLSVSVVKNYQL